MKKKKYKEIINNSIEGYHQGYAHRRHRGKKRNNNINSKSLNTKKDKEQEIIDKEWERIRKCYNIISWD